jgi:hypothetical protein
MPSPQCSFDLFFVGTASGKFVVVAPRAAVRRFAVAVASLGEFVDVAPRTAVAAPALSWRSSASLPPRHAPRRRVGAVTAPASSSWSRRALLAAIREDEEEVSPSTLFAVASILSGAAYINGSRQNTFVAGVIDSVSRSRSLPPCHERGAASASACCWSRLERVELVGLHEADEALRGLL